MNGVTVLCRRVPYFRLFYPFFIWAANFTLPEKGSLFDEVEFTELKPEEAKDLVKKYNEEGRAACGPPQSRSRFFDRNEDRDRGFGGGGRGFRGGPFHRGTLLTCWSTQLCCGVSLFFHGEEIGENVFEQCQKNAVTS